MGTPGIWNVSNTTMAFMPHGSPSCHLPHHSYHTHDKWSRRSDHSQLAPGNGTCTARSSSAGRRSSPAEVRGSCSTSGITRHLFLKSLGLLMSFVSGPFLCRSNFWFSPQFVPAISMCKSIMNYTAIICNPKEPADFIRYPFCILWRDLWFYNICCTHVCIYIYVCVCHIISHHIISHHIISHHITSHHITSHHISLSLLFSTISCSI